MKILKVRVTTTEEMLGTASSNKEIHKEFIASKAPDAESMEEEVAAVGAEEVFEKGMTVFPRNEQGDPIAWDYQWKGFFKDACGMLRKVPKTECGKIKAYKKEIDGLIFIQPRMIPIEFDGEIGTCQRPLRAQTAQGERVALTSSESIPAGARMDFEIVMLQPDHEKAIREMLGYGMLRGFGQWRNSGKGRFTFEVLEEREE
ncbi:MAG: hypothetical protein J6T99_00215 [Oscillospiraceae bacterium]|nr:hypothetical protein [Oscillospiraceae bacterium]